MVAEAWAVTMDVFFWVLCAMGCFIAMLPLIALINAVLYLAKTIDIYLAIKQDALEDRLYDDFEKRSDG